MTFERRLGRSAYHLGRTVSDNPYKRGSASWHEWWNGWSEAHGGHS